MSQRQFDQPTGAQAGQQGQYQQPPGGRQGVQQRSGGQGGQGVQQSPAGGQGMASGQQVPAGGQGATSKQGSGGAQGTGGLQGQLFPTQNYLAEDVRVGTIENLNRVLADATILHTHAKFAHWNVKGLEFVGLHELFDEIAETFEEHTDEIGERITALGGQAMGTAGMAVTNCSLPSMPTDAVTGSEYVEILADRLAIHDANLYDAIRTAEQYDDADTADLLNEISREVSQYLWFLEAHLQTQPVESFQVGGQGSQQPGASGQQFQGQGTGGPGARQPGGTQQPATTPPQPSTAQPSQQPPSGQSTTQGGQGGGSVQPSEASYERGQTGTQR